MIKPLMPAIAAAVLAATYAAPAHADLAIKPAMTPDKSADRLAMSDAARLVMAEYQIKDVHPVSGVVPEIILGDAVLRLGPHRPIIDARIVNVYFVSKARFAPEPYAATTAQAIDAWTNTVLLGSPSGYGTSVDQWVAMAWYLGPL